MVWGHSQAVGHQEREAGKYPHHPSPPVFGPPAVDCHWLTSASSQQAKTPIEATHGGQTPGHGADEGRWGRVWRSEDDIVQDTLHLVLPFFLLTQGKQSDCFVPREVA